MDSGRTSELTEKRLFIALSGASGSIYAKRLINSIAEAYDTIYLTASDNAISILQDETGEQNLGDLIPIDAMEKFSILDPSDIGAPPASGSHDYDAMVIVPCSMGVVGRIASGISNDLITRAADVCLKERRKLILVVRESPFSLIHLENMTKLAQAGATIMPAAPAFYNKPETIDDLVDFVVDRILRHLGTDVRLMDGWKE